MQTLFKRACAVTINIQAKPKAVWAILTNVANFTKWNSTVISMEGKIGLNETVKLKATSAPERTFNLKVTEFTPPSRLVWRDGFAPIFQGVRVYTLKPNADGSTDFEMKETISGLMLPMIGGSLPDFRPYFEDYARDLKREAEKG